MVAQNKGFRDPFDYTPSDTFESSTREAYAMLPVSRPIAIRSSATDECANGTYKTFFMHVKIMISHATYGRFGKEDDDNDFIHIGKRKSRGIALVTVGDNFGPNDLDCIAYIGYKHPEFLLLVPSIVFSAKHKYGLPLSSLKNAAGVIELGPPKSMKSLDSWDDEFIKKKLNHILLVGQI